MAWKSVIALMGVFKLFYNIGSLLISHFLFQMVDLLFAVGGSVGLWLGLSVITVVEVLELFYDIGSLLISCCLPTKPTELPVNT